jgi:uncharacterized protein (UPF0371 family)
LLLPQQRRKSKQVDLPSRLETPDQVRRSEERDRALARRARRKREEVSAERASFELARDRIIFGLQLALAAIGIVAIAIALERDPGLVPLLLLGGGWIGGLTAIKRRGSEDRP